MIPGITPLSRSTKDSIGKRPDLRNENRELDEIELFKKYNLGLLGISITCGPVIHHEIASGVSNFHDGGMALDYFGKPYIGGVLGSDGTRR